MPDVSEMRAALARLGIRGRDVAMEMGVGNSLFYKILSGGRTMPEGFEARFYAVVRAKAEAKAAALKAEAEMRANKLVSAAEEVAP